MPTTYLWCLNCWMKAILTFFFVGVGFFSVCAQNLVPNASFEDTVHCPSPLSIGQLDLTYHWFSPTTGTPDFFHSCGSNWNNPLTSYIGSQQPHSGDAHVGIFLWQSISFSGINDVREYIGAPLLSRLKAGKCYHFEMYVNAANKAKYTTDAIGACFTDTFPILDSLTFLLPLTPQVENLPGVFFDTLLWSKVTGNFTAQGGEKYLIIGNFKNDSNTVVQLTGIGTQATSYCYIDDVSLTEIDVAIGNDTMLCQGETLQLTATPGFESYAWQDGSSASTYLFADTALGSYNLSVTAVDSNGCLATDTLLVNVDQCLGVSDVAENSTFTILPNPTSGFVNVFVPKGKYDVTVTDPIGRVMFQYRDAGFVTPIDLSSQPDGVYFVAVERDLVVQVAKVVLIK